MSNKFILILMIYSSLLVLMLVTSPGCLSLPNQQIIGNLYKILHNQMATAVSKIKEAEELYSLESRIFLESTGILSLPTLLLIFVIRVLTARLLILSSLRIAQISTYEKST